MGVVEMRLVNAFLMGSVMSAISFLIVFDVSGVVPGWWAFAAGVACGAIGMAELT